MTGECTVGCEEKGRSIDLNEGHQWFEESLRKVKDDAPPNRASLVVCGVGVDSAPSMEVLETFVSLDCSRGRAAECRSRTGQSFCDCTLGHPTS